MQIPNVHIFYLEMLQRFQRVVPPPREGLAVIQARRPTLSFYRFLCRAVGKDYYWYRRETLPDADLTALIQSPLNELHVLYVDGSPAGFAELDCRRHEEIRVVQFGLMPEFLGQGLGRYFLQWTVDKAWEHDPERCRLQTCSLDHPAALPCYLKAGFKVYEEEVITEEVPD